jgi:hypothetical protein
MFEPVVIASHRLQVAKLCVTIAAPTATFIQSRSWQQTD